MSSPITWTLPNGIRIIHQQTTGNVAHCGLMLNTGSRDELEHEQGMAHYIEHAIFKGTGKRKAFHVLTRMEDVGGEINAYTGKEETCVYSSFVHVHYERAIELLADIVFNPSFPPKELEKEKTVIIDEINAYRDSPSEEIFDRFDELAFPNHPLGRDILGTAKTLKSFQLTDIHSFIKRTWNTDQLVFSSVGNISLKSLEKLVMKYFGVIPENRRSFERTSPMNHSPQRISLKKRTHQTHILAGTRAYPMHDTKRTGLILLNNLLGGPGMSSRLNLAIREKYGFAYSIDSGYTMYSDTGLWTVYIGTDHHFAERSIELVLKELRKLREQPLGHLQLMKAKNQLIGQMAVARESNSSLMIALAKTWLVFNKIDTFEEIVEKINAYSSKDLCAIANEVFDETQFSYLIFRGR